MAVTTKLSKSITRNSLHIIKKVPRNGGGCGLGRIIRFLFIYRIFPYVHIMYKHNIYSYIGNINVDDMIMMSISIYLALDKWRIIISDCGCNEGNQEPPLLQIIMIYRTIRWMMTSSHVIHIAQNFRLYVLPYALIHLVYKVDWLHILEDFVAFRHASLPRPAADRHWLYNMQHDIASLMTKHVMDPYSLWMTPWTNQSQDVDLW